MAGQVKQKLDEAQLKAQLTLAGYSHVSQVVSPGEYAVRGGLIDLFPMGSLVPYRVDLFDDEIDSIRTFDPDSQRSLYPVPEVRLLPGREFPMDEAARAKFRSRWRELLEGDPTKSRIYKDMGDGMATAGIEYYLPLFFEQTATLFHSFDAEGASSVRAVSIAAFAALAALLSSPFKRPERFESRMVRFVTVPLCSTAVPSASGWCGPSSRPAACATRACSRRWARSRSRSI